MKIVPNSNDFGFMKLIDLTKNGKKQLRKIDEIKLTKKHFPDAFQLYQTALCYF